MVTQRFKTTAGARLKELRVQVERDPLNVNKRFNLASSLEAAGKLEDAIKQLAIAVEKGRRNLGVAHCNYAVALMKKNRPDDAFRHFDLSIEADPSNASFYLSNKAHALMQVGLAEKAKAIYQQIVRKPEVSKETQRIAVKRLKDMDR